MPPIKKANDVCLIKIINKVENKIRENLFWIIPFAKIIDKVKKIKSCTWTGWNKCCLII